MALYSTLISSVTFVHFFEGCEHSGNLILKTLNTCTPRVLVVNVVLDRHHPFDILLGILIIKNPD
mgnify:FL=1